MNKKIAVIVVGTNNVSLLIAKKDGLNIEILKRKSDVSALGRNMENGKLTNAAIRRTKSILHDNILYSKLVTDEIIVIATSCSRDAKNIIQLSNWLKKKHNLKYNVISGKKEAYLNGLANLNEFSADNCILLFDVGGGSTEFTVIKNKEITSTNSIELGVRRLDTSFKYDFNNKINWTKNMLQKFKIQKNDNYRLIMIGDIAQNIAALVNDYNGATMEVMNKCKVKKAILQKLLVNFRKYPATLVKDKLNSGQIRSEIVSTGLMIVIEILTHFKVKECTISEHGISSGILYQSDKELKKMLKN